MPESRRLRRLLPAVLLVLAATAAAGEPVALRPPWQPLPEPGAPSLAAPVSVPALDPAEGVRLLHRDPAAFPRPTVDTARGPVVLPVAARVENVTRRTDERGSVVTWGVEASPRRSGDGLVVELDFPPHAQEDDGPLRTPLPVDGATGETLPNREEALQWRLQNPPDTARWRVDPARRRGPAPESIAEPPASVPPRLTVERVTEAVADGLIATCDGTTWTRLSLADPPSPPPSHELEAHDVVALEVGGRCTLHATPRPLGQRAVLELLAVDAATLESKSLGSPAPEGSSWSRSISDVRVLPDGRLEAVVLVHDAFPKRPERFDTWGAVMVRDPATGAWSERVRIGLPGSAPDLRAGFDTADASRLLLLDGDQAIGAMPIP